MNFCHVHLDHTRVYSLLLHQLSLPMTLLVIQQPVCYSFPLTDHSKAFCLLKEMQHYCWLMPYLLHMLKIVLVVMKEVLFGKTVVHNSNWNKTIPYNWIVIWRGNSYELMWCVLALILLYPLCLLLLKWGEVRIINKSRVKTQSIVSERNTRTLLQM